MLRFLLLTLILFAQNVSADGLMILPACKEKEDCSLLDKVDLFNWMEDANTNFFLNEVSKEAVNESLEQYGNSLLAAPEINELLAQSKCDSSENREKIRQIVQKIVANDLQIASGTRNEKTLLSSCSKTLGGNFDELADRIVERTTAYACGDVDEANMPHGCKSSKVSKENRILAGAIQNANLKAAAEDLRAIDKKMSEYSRFNGVTCSSGGVCYKDVAGTQIKLQGDTAAEAFQGLKYFDILRLRKNEILSANPVLGLSGAVNSSFVPKTTFGDAFSAPLDKLSISSQVGAGNSGATEYLKQNSTRLYQKLSSNGDNTFAIEVDVKANKDDEALRWAHATSRRNAAALGLSHVCGGEDERADQKSIAYELISIRSPIVLRTLNKNKFEKPEKAGLYCNAEHAAQKHKRGDTIKKAALTFSVAAVGIAASGPSGGTSLSLVAASAGLGLGLTVNETQEKMNKAGLGKAMNQACLLGFNELSKKEAEAERAKTDALLNYGFEAAGVFAEGAKIMTAAAKAAEAGKVIKKAESTTETIYKKTHSVITDSAGDSSKAQALEDFVTSAKAKGYKVDDEFMEGLSKIHETGYVQETGLDPKKAREMARWVQKHPDMRDELMKLAEAKVIGRTRDQELSFRGVLGQEDMNVLRGGVSKPQLLEMNAKNVDSAVGKLGGRNGGLENLTDLGYQSHAGRDGVSVLKKGKSSIEIPKSSGPLDPAEQAKLKKAMLEGTDYKHPDVFKIDYVPTKREIETIVSEAGTPRSNGELIAIGYKRAEVNGNYVYSKGSSVITLPKSGKFTEVEKTNLKSAIESRTSFTHTSAK